MGRKKKAKLSLDAIDQLGIPLAEPKRAEVERTLADLCTGGGAQLVTPKDTDDNHATIDDSKLYAKDYIDAHRLQRLHQLAHELAKRRLEALSLYEPMDVQEDFHSSKAPYRLIIGGNRAGKTLSTAVEVARAVTGQDPHGKFPARDGLAFLVGKDAKHLGTVMYRKLFKAGAFKMIRDLDTRKWRAWRPWEESDADREHECKFAPPLIPARFVQDVAWENKKANVPNIIRLNNGWELHFFSSLGKPPQGSPIDLFWFDEEIIDPAWYPEMAARVVDRRGRGLWSATPQAGTDQLYELHERAEKEFTDLEKGDRRIEEFRISLLDNKFMSEKAKVEFASDINEEEYRVRVEGEFAILSAKVYPTFNITTHGWGRTEVPAEWCRYAYVDPGYRRCAVLFVAVSPPPEDTLVIYDELYLKDCDAELFAQRMKIATQNQSMQAFMLDMHGGLITQMAAGKTVMQQYSEALQRHNVKSIGTGSGFLLANDDKTAGLLAGQGLLRVRENGTSKLRVIPERCPNFIWEIKRYHRKRIKGVVQEAADDSKDNHLMDCFDSETEVLTENGWMPFSEIRMGDSLATVNLESNMIEYQNPTDLIAKPHIGNMIRFGGHKLDAMVTPTHRMVVYPKKGYKGYDGGKPVVKLAQDVTVWDSIKLNGKWNGNLTSDGLVVIPKCGGAAEVSVGAGDLAELIGWYVAEGCCERKIQMPGRGYQVVISQLKQGGRDSLRRLFAKLPWHWIEMEKGFYCSSKQLWSQLECLGMECYSKMAPQWILDASPCVIERFLDGAIAGDGWVQNGKRTYATTSKRLADQVQECFIKIGKSASVRIRPAQECLLRPGCDTVDQYWVCEWTLPTGGLRNKDNDANFGTVEYDGMVYCATVPNGTLIVRRNGKPMVAGNCFRYMALHSPKYIKPVPPKKILTGAIAAFKKKNERKATSGGDNKHITLGPGGRFYK